MFAFTLALMACGNDGDNSSHNSNQQGNNHSKTNDNTTPETPSNDAKSFIAGADISWVTEQEADGVKFFNTDGQQRDCFTLMKEIGMHAIRLRVWVDPQGYGYGKWCDKDDVVKKAVRAKNVGLDVMIDFHYSDFFADPSRQETPKAWQGLGLEDLKTKVKEHTVDVLSAVKQAGVNPKWVQVGNETRNGMMWPTGQFYDPSKNYAEISGAWENYVALTNAGYDAVKQVLSNATVIVHLNNAWQDCDWWFAKYRELGGKMDMIGLSHYPMAENDKTWKEVNSLALKQIIHLINKYKVSVMITEIGVKSGEEDASNAIEEFVNDARAIDQCMGAFYWEPQVYGGWVPAYYKTVKWGSYDMGGFTNDGRPTWFLCSMTRPLAP